MRLILSANRHPATVTLSGSSATELLQALDVVLRAGVRAQLLDPLLRLRRPGPAALGQLADRAGRLGAGRPGRLVRAGLPGRLGTHLAGCAGAELHRALPRA